MTLIETLTLGVGAGIAKGIFKIWFDDRLVLGSAADGVVDALKSCTKDFLARRSAQRLFDQIAEGVAGNLLEVVESEGAGLSDRQQRVVVDAANVTLDDTDFTAKWLIERNLQPDPLLKRLLQQPQQTGRPILSGFSELQHDLYRRILSEASQYIVDIAPQMPAFTEQTLTEMLRRDAQLLRKADLILAEVRRIRRESATGDLAEARFENDYRRAVVRRLDQLQLFGVDLDTASKRYRLSVAYVTLLVERKALPTPHEGRAEGDSPIFASRKSGQSPSGSLASPEALEEEEEAELQETLPVDRALAGGRRLFVRGPAGSGKTTLLQWVAVTAASRMLTDDLAAWNDCVPFLIRLREFSDRPLPKPSEFVELISRPRADDMPGGWVQRRLKSGQAVVLVDGLDEVPEERRDEVRSWLADLTDEQLYPDARFVLTSRPHAAEEGWLEELGFADAELQEMDADDVDAFIDHWHEAVAEGLQSEDQREQLRELQAELKPKVRANRAVRRLVTSPLLCALICALHREHVQELPSDRIELYRLCLEMFFRLDRERRIRLPDYPEIGDRQKRALLADLAYWLIGNGWSQVAEARADERLERALRRLEGIPSETTGRAVRRLFVERTGILRQPDPGQVDFPHRSFQEYLAAVAAVEEGDLGVLLQNAHDDQWHEVVVLAAGLGKPAEAEEIIAGLLKRGDKTKKHRSRLHLLAVGCLETVVELPEYSPVKQEVRRRLAEIVPPKNLTEAKELAAAGELVVPHLVYEPRRRVKETVACVRTLALIGGELAYAALARYAEDPRLGVLLELLRSRDLTRDGEEYDRCFLGRVTGGPKSLSLAGRANLTHVSPLAGLTNLRSLDLRLTQVSDVSPLDALKRKGLSIHR